MRSKKNSSCFGLIFLAGSLTACSSAARLSSDDAYWKDPRWAARVFHAVQSAIHYPLDSADQPIGEPVTVHGKIEFTYLDGKIYDPEITESTGRSDLDAAMLQQVAAAKPPLATGSHAKEPHAIAVELEMHSPLEALEYSLMQAIEAKRFYPKEAVLKGTQGVVAVAFDYGGAEATDVVIAKSSRDRALDAAALLAVSRAELPPPPAWLSPRPLHMRINICYSLGFAGACPAVTQKVIEIVETPGTAQASSPPSGP
jgi:TonB family protein